MRTTNHLYVELEKPLNDEILFSGGKKLYLDPEYNKEWNATVTGIVKAIPATGLHGIKVGDEIAFSYMVVAERQYPDDKSNFHPHIDTPQIKEFLNGKGQRLRVVGFDGAITKKFTAYLTDRFRHMIDGIEGSESEIERWMSQFTFGDPFTYKFTNCHNIEGKLLWKVEPQHIIAIKRGDKIKMVADKILCEPIDVDYTDQVRIMNGLILPDTQIIGRYQDRAKAAVNSPSVEVSKGDIVSFQPDYTEKYTLWGKEYFMIHNSRVLGFWDNKN